MAKTKSLTQRQVTNWVSGYVKAWNTGDPKDIEALLTPDCESHEWPYETAWIGRQEIVDGWQTRAPWQEGGWTFDWVPTDHQRRHLRVFHPVRAAVGCAACSRQTGRPGEALARSRLPGLCGSVRKGLLRGRR
jgi:hypothetical protein